MPHRLIRILAWLLLAAIAFVTLSPVGLRPESGFSPNYERFAAFAAVGLIFVLAYPRHIWLVLGLVLCAALCLELAQLLVSDRHGRLIDLIAKLAGGGAGVVAGVVVRSLWARIAATRS